MDALALNLSDYDFFINNLPFGLLVFNSEGEIIFSNSKANKILKLPNSTTGDKRSFNCYWNTITKNNTNSCCQDNPVLKSIKTGKNVKGIKISIYIAEINASKWIAVDAIPQICPVTLKVIRVFTFINDLSENQNPENTKNNSFREKLLIEKTISKISSRFIGVFNLDDAINQSLAEVGAVSKASRVYLFLIKENGKLMDNTHEWCRKGVKPQIKRLQNLSTNIYPWWMKKLHNNEIINISHVSLMPEEAWMEREIIEKQNIKSLLVLPLRIRDKLIGFIGFDYTEDYREWNNKDIIILRMIENIFSNAIEKKQAERQLSENEIKFRNIFEDHAAPKLLIDPDTFYIIDANKAASRFFNLSQGNLIKMNIRQISLTPPEELRARSKRLKEGIKYNTIFKSLTKKDRLRYIESFNSLVEYKGKKVIHSIFFDITEKKKIEDQLILFKTAIIQSPESIFITDRDSKIIYANPKFFATTGYTQKEILGHKINILNSGYQDKEFYKCLWDTITSGSNWYGEILNKNKNGELFWEYVSISPIMNEETGEINYFVAIKQDINERKKYRDELITAKEKAEESNRLKSSFLATISHELRTPLNAVIGFSEIIKDSTRERETSEFAEMIFNSGVDLLGIIDNIISLSIIGDKKVTLKDEVFRLYSLFTVLEKQLQEMIIKAGKQDSVKLSFIADTKLLQEIIIADKGIIIQVISNLMKNAVKFTEKGFIKLGIIKDGSNNLSIFIEDTGIGIPKEKQKVIFDYFSQADDSLARKFGGVGIGLTISNRLAITLGGKISFKSVWREGSVFSFSFPAKIYVDKNEPEHKSSYLIPDFTGCAILIVEDNYTNLLLATKILISTGATVLNARNGKEALDILKRKKSVNAIVMDIKMPVMNGLEATRIIKPNYKVPIIALTAYSDEEKRAFEAGCDGVITKPINKMMLYDLLEKLIKTE